MALRPVIQPALDRELSAPVFKSLRRVKVNAVVARGRELCREQPLTFAALGDALAREFPAADPHALAIAVRNHVALAQVPPRGRWRTAAPTVHVPVADWLDSPVATDPDPAPLVRRYLTAFGPATAADIATWSGLRGIKVLLERLRDELRWFTDDRGRTLVDVPDGILPGPDVPAPVRLLPEYDNALLSHADRTRIIADGDRPFVFTRNGHVGGTVLVDGYVRATWRTELLGRCGDLDRPTARQADRGQPVGHRTGGVGVAGVCLPGTRPSGGVRRRSLSRAAAFRACLTKRSARLSVLECA